MAPNNASEHRDSLVPEAVLRADSLTIASFKAAYQQYAQKLGTNTVEAVAITHYIGDSQDSCIYTMHVRLRAVEQTLIAFVLLSEASMAEIGDWLDMEFDSDLLCLEDVVSNCELITDGVLMIDETTAMRVDPDRPEYRWHQLMPQSIETVEEAIRTYVSIDVHRSNEATAGKRRVSIYWPQNVAKEYCPKCEALLSRYWGIIEEEHADGTRFGICNGSIHKNARDEFITLLTWLARQDMNCQITDTSRLELSDLEIIERIKTATGAPDLKVVMESLSKAFNNFSERLKNTREGDEPGREKKTFH